MIDRLEGFIVKKLKKKQFSQNNLKTLLERLLKMVMFKGQLMAHRKKLEMKRHARWVDTQPERLLVARRGREPRSV